MASQSDGKERYTIRQSPTGVSIKINDTNPETRYRPATREELASAVRKSVTTDTRVVR